MKSGSISRSVEAADSMWNEEIDGISYAGKISVEQIEMTGGTPLQGKVLTSDDDGLSTWEVPLVNYIGITGAMPVLTDNVDGTVSISESTVVMHNNDDYFDNPLRYTITAATNLVLTNNANNYLIVNYNSGTPIYEILTDVLLINESDILPVYTIYRKDLFLNILPWKSLADGLPNKLHARSVKTKRFEREESGGLLISESGTKNINVSEGKIWYGGTKLTIGQFQSSLTPMNFLYHVAGVWTYGTSNVYNNLQYDDGTDLQTLLSNKFTVNWLFSQITDGTSQVYLVLGDTYNKISEAEAAKTPADIPDLLLKNTILIGRLIVEQNVTPAIIQSAFDVVFSSTGASTYWTQIGNDLYYNLGNVGIGTATPDGLLDCTPDIITTTSYTYPFPRVTTTEKNDLTGMTVGAHVVDITLNEVWWFNSTAWIKAY